MSADSNSPAMELPDRAPTKKESAARKSRIGTVWKVTATAAVLTGTALVLATSYLLSSVRGTMELQNADALVESERFAEAVPLYTAALKEKLFDSQRALALGSRGWAYTKLNRDSDAIQDFDAALQIAPELEFALLDRGLAYHRHGRFNEALADYDKTIALDPNSLDAYRNRALILAHLGRWKDAIADMTEAARCDDTNPAWFVARADYYVQEGKLESALASYESAIRIDPENSDAFWGRAKIFARQNQLDRALSEMTEAIRARPSSAQLYVARGLMQIEAKAPQMALADFNAAIGFQPGFATAYANRATIEMILGDREAAEKDAERATELDPQLSQAQLTLGFVHLRRGEFEQAIEDFDRAIVCDSENVWAVVWHASAQAKLARYELARLELREAVRRFPGAYQTHMLQGWFLATCPNWIYRDGAAAVSAARRAVALSKGDAYALDVLAAANAEASEFAGACAAELRALERLGTGGFDQEAMEARLRLYRERKPCRDDS